MPWVMSTVTEAPLRVVSLREAGTVAKIEARIVVLLVTARATRLTAPLPVRSWTGLRPAV